MVEPGSLLRAARETAGISLRAMAERTYYSPAYLSLIESGKRPVPAGVAAAYERVLGADLDRLTAVARSPASVDAMTLADVAVMLSATRRIEDAAGAVTVLPAVRGMSAMTETFAREARTRTARTEVAALASEVVQYRAWLEHAIGADSAARATMRTAIDLAEESRDPDRLVHALGFAGYVTVSTGDYGKVIALSDAALAVRDAHPTLVAYGRMRRAELLAARGESREAGRALAAAEPEAANDPPQSMYWWTPGFAAVQRAGVLALLGHTADAVREATHGVAAMPAEHRGTAWLASALRRVDPDMSADGSR
ncbi:helix-turn-helix transcriptional regulator [Nocardia sp. NBC_00508]|uniref:helix-turn-helix domain-containing protein n=1 Tax=Nocardia sp. NBC_00508 TaxID=2975992 RepID=UPI002E8141F2|nr:helix-turn-helix transcriptional regulator [Nocardia sp. NBC_00508]WUD68773.1 helix-turn-helix transcriptional regulator [Nocardia sp. NBC_00508]